MAGAHKGLELELTRRDLLKVAGTAVGSAAVAYTVTSGPLSPFSELRRRQQSGTDAPHADASPVSRVLEANPHLRLREDLGTEPSVHYIPPKEGGSR